MTATVSASRTGRDPWDVDAFPLPEPLQLNTSRMAERVVNPKSDAIGVWVRTYPHKLIGKNRTINIVRRVTIVRGVEKWRDYRVRIDEPTLLEPIPWENIWDRDDVCADVRTYAQVHNELAEHLP